MPPRKPKKNRWVIKAGSNMVCAGGPLLLRAWMQQVAELKRAGQIEIIWVTSGAIAAAVDRTGYKQTTRTLSDKQALSAIGQPLLMDLYNIALGAVGLMGSQILLTYDDMANPVRRENLQNTLTKLLEWNAVPILNENDAVANEEIKFGDNDSLSAKVACMMNADRLVILTDVEGLYDKNPAVYPRAKRIARVARVTEGLLATVEPAAGSARGTGGMYSKLVAAREASLSGIETYLVKGDTVGALLKILRGENPGTRIGGRT